MAAKHRPKAPSPLRHATSAQPAATPPAYIAGRSAAQRVPEVTALPLFLRSWEQIEAVGLRESTNWMIALGYSVAAWA